jgi:3-oxoacyl-[acyl-carrier protein] reductase
MTPGPLAGKVALVTGASRGIGRGIALRLARDGCTVAVNYARAEQQAAEVVAQAQAMGREAWAVRCDVADLAQVRAMVSGVHRRCGRLDILVNNAGDAIRKPFDQISEADYDHQFGLARGAFFAMQEAARHMADGGRIINISSAAARSCPADAAIYAGAKAAMEAFTRSQSRELGARGITVNVVAPGATMTELLQGAPEHIVQSVKRNAFGRAAEIDDVADVVAMLCGNDARWLTGQVIHADGGL